MRVPIAVLLLAATAQAFAARPLTELLGRVPPPPASAAAAAGWVDESLQITESRYLNVAADLKAEQEAGNASATQAGMQVAAGSGVSIDQSRVHDPAYQQELQQRYSSMTPAEMMALAAQSQAAAMQDSLRIGQEPPEVLAAFQAYQEMMASLGASGANHYSVLEQRDMAAIVARFDPQQAALDQQLQDCNECDAAGVARAQVSNQAVWRRKLALADQEARDWQAFFVRAKASREGAIAKGHAQLAAAGYGAKAQSMNMRQNLTAYHLMLLGRIEELMAISAEAARRTGGVAVRARVQAGV